MLWGSFYLHINSAQVVGTSRFFHLAIIMSAIMGVSETSIVENFKILRLTEQKFDKGETQK